MSSVTNDPEARPDPTIGANWDDGHVPAPAGHAPELGWFEYYLDDRVGQQSELRELDTGACLVVENTDALCDVVVWR